MPASMMRCAHGPVRPTCAHGSSVQYSVAPRASSPLRSVRAPRRAARRRAHGRPGRRPPPRASRRRRRPADSVSSVPTPASLGECTPHEPQIVGHQWPVLVICAADSAARRPGRKARRVEPTGLSVTEERRRGTGYPARKARYI
jgi:hypothetical protein